MRQSVFSLLLMFAALGLLAGCGDDVADAPNLSEEGKTIVEEVGGPFSAAEFTRFMADLPSIPGLTSESQKYIGDATGTALSAQVMAAIEDRGWDEERFMYIYSHTMTMVSAEQMNKISEQMQAQLEGMPEEQKEMMQQMIDQQVGGQMEAFQAELDQQVPASEQAIVKDNLAELYSVLGIE